MTHEQELRAIIQEMRDDPYPGYVGDFADRLESLLSRETVNAREQVAGEAVALTNAELALLRGLNESWRMRKTDPLLNEYNAALTKAIAFCTHPAPAQDEVECLLCSFVNGDHDDDCPIAIHRSIAQDTRTVTTVVTSNTAHPVEFVHPAPKGEDEARVFKVNDASIGIALKAYNATVGSEWTKAHAVVSALVAAYAPSTKREGG